MDKKLILGGLAGGVTFFILGFIFYAVLMRDFLAANCTPGVYKEMPDFPFLIFGNIVMGFFYALVVGSWANASSAGEGAKKGFILALLLGLGFNMIMYGTSNIMTMAGTLGDIGITTVMGTIVGAVVAMIRGTSNKAA